MRNRSLTLALVLLLAGRAAADKRYRVTVDLPDEPSIHGAPVLVFARRGDGWEPTPRAVALHGDERSVVLTLPPGRYAVEVGASSPGGVALLRDSGLRVPQNRQVTLTAVHATAVTPIDGTDADVKQIAVRRSGNGEVRWTAAQPDAVNKPQFVLSTGEPYVLSACGETDAVLTAIWKPVTVRPAAPAATTRAVAERPTTMADDATPNDAGPIRFADTEGKYQLTVAAAPDAPTLQDCFVEMQFPDANLHFSRALHKRRFVTNRDRALVRYEVATAAGERLHFSPRGLVFKSRTELVVGSPPRAVLFAGGIYPRFREDKTVLRTQVFLLDRYGRTLDFSRSAFDYAASIRLRDDKGRETDVPSDAFTGREVPSAHFCARLRFSYGGPQQLFVQSGTDWVKRSSTHFEFNAPAPLLWRAEIYLQSMELVRRINAMTTRRPAPTWIPILWKLHDADAVAGIGRGDGSNANMWMVFPFQFLEQIEPLREPGWGDSPIAVHENLHNFGYTHTEEPAKTEFSRLESQGNAEYESLRWRAADTGVWPVWAD